MHVSAEQHPNRDAVIAAVLDASRTFVAIAARSLGTADSGVTLPQFRALVVLATRGPTRLVDLALDLAVAPSTAGRMFDRLEEKELVARSRSATDRREVTHVLTKRGKSVVTRAMTKRRSEIGRIVDEVPAEVRVELVRSLEAFAAATKVTGAV